MTALSAIYSLPTEFELTSSLVDTLTDEICREQSFLKIFLFLERIMLLRVRHATACNQCNSHRPSHSQNSPARLEPTIENFIDTLQVTFALLGWNSDVVYLVTM